MRVPLSWLRQYCDPPLSAREIADRLDLTGTEVSRVERVGVGDPDGFVVGRVELVAPHPNADRLSVCVVDDGSGSPRTIVCGAPNVVAGQTVAVALPGALMPNGEPLTAKQSPMCRPAAWTRISTSSSLGVGMWTSWNASRLGGPYE